MYPCPAAQGSGAVDTPCAPGYREGMFGGLFGPKKRSYPAPVDQLKGELWVIQGARLGEKWSLDEGDLKVGRAMDEEELAEAAGRAVSFPDHCKLISGQHAVFKKQADGYWVYDLASKNGTTVGGRRIEKALLMDGDEVDIGQVVFRLKVHAPDAAQTLTSCTLTIVSGPRQGDTWTLADRELPVGRDLEGEGISFPETEGSVSSDHALFKRVKGAVWVQDKGSKNGTFVNGKRIERVELKDGDRVDIGGATFEVRIGG